MRKAIIMITVIMLIISIVGTGVIVFTSTQSVTPTTNNG